MLLKNGEKKGKVSHLFLEQKYYTVESRFLETPRETKIGWRNREFQKGGIKSDAVVRFS